ncbi:hypothetical protein CRENBAI_005951 [Crenichthys baileyi]|uniref:Uncharacterized protein n=1 Tax=Crenichthys baileyi TaxID=28760 RepID=A0AAV9SLW2_9TELE
MLLCQFVPPPSRSLICNQQLFPLFSLPTVCLLRALYCLALVVSDLVAFLNFSTTLSSLWYLPPPALEDDMHRVIDQQLMDKHQDEWHSVHASLSGSSRSQSPRRARRISDRDKRLFSFFKKS